MHHAAGSRFIKRNCCKTHTPHHPRKEAMTMRVPRCSRPLCSSQTTTPYHTPRTNHPQKRGRPPTHGPCSQETRNTQTRDKRHANPNRPRTHATALLPQDPTVCQTRKTGSPPPAPFQDTRTKRNESIRTRGGKEPTGRYLLIFHP